MFFCRLALAVCGLSAMICAGCGGSPKLYPASGTVKYDGTPLADASILFIPQGGRPSIGATDASGNYTMSTGGKPGVPAGTYSVTVSKSSGEAGGSQDVQLPPSDAQVSEEEINKMKEQMQEQMRGMDKRARPKPAIPVKYSLPEGSGLTATVNAEKHEFNFDLTP